MAIGLAARGLGAILSNRGLSTIIPPTAPHMDLGMEVKGAAALKWMMENAPEELRKVIRRRLFTERKRYVGSGKHTGRFQKALVREKRTEFGQGAFRRGGRWPENVASAFAGRVHTRGMSGFEMYAVMGLGLSSGTRRSKFIKGLAAMEESSKLPRTLQSRKYMPIPAYKNLSTTGITKDFHMHFLQMARSGRLIPLKSNGKIYWFDRLSPKVKRGRYSGRFRKSSLLFMGTKKAHMKKNIDFRNRFYKEDWPKVQRRMSSAIGREARALKLGYKKRVKKEGKL